MTEHKEDELDASSLIEMLREHPFFSDYSEAIVSLIIQQASIHDYVKDDDIAVEEEVIDAIYFIIQGRCDYIVNDPFKFHLMHQLMQLFSPEPKLPTAIGKNQIQTYF